MADRQMSIALAQLRKMAPLLVGALSPPTASAVLAKTTAQGAVKWLAGETVIGGISAQAVAIASGGIRAMLVMTFATAFLAVVGLVGVSIGLAAVNTSAGNLQKRRHHSSMGHGSTELFHPPV